MKRLQRIETLRGNGTLSDESIEPIAVSYELEVSQWVHRFESADGISESPGTYHMEVVLTVPTSAARGMVSLIAAGSAAVLVLRDGRKAQVLVSNSGNLISPSPTSRIRCKVNSLEGYG